MIEKIENSVGHALELFSARDYEGAFGILSRLELSIFQCSDELVSNAFFSLGEMYYKGLFPKFSDHKARAYYNVAARNGSEKAMVREAEELLFSQKPKGIKLYSEGFERGSRLARRALYNAMLNYNAHNQITPQIIRAAAQAGSPRAMANLAVALELGDFLPSAVESPKSFLNRWRTPISALHDINAARSEAMKWYRMAAIAGDERLIKFFISGNSEFMKDGYFRLNAMDILRESFNISLLDLKNTRKDDDIFANSVLGFAHIFHEDELMRFKDRLGIMPDATLGMKYLVQAAKLGSPFARDFLCTAYYYGDRVEQSCEKALAWSLLARQADQNFVCALEINWDVTLDDVERMVDLQTLRKIHDNPEFFI